MKTNKKYNTDKEKLISTFKIKEGKLTHDQCKRFKLLPYTTQDANLVETFDGVLGAFSRIISSKEIKDKFNFEDFIGEIVDQVGIFEGEKSKEVFIDIIQNMFIDKELLVNFDIKTLNYISATKQEEKIAVFLYSILFSEELNKLVSKKYGKEVANVLYQLVLNALPELADKKYRIDDYKCYVPFIKDLFIKDFKFIMENEELYKSSLQRFLEYYYMFYIGQLSIKLSEFEKADLAKVSPIYYTLNWESTSKNRKAYKFGWNMVKRIVESLFSHAVTLEILNHHGLEEQLGYKELFELLALNNELDMLVQTEKMYQIYQTNINDVNWAGLKAVEIDSGSLAFNNVYKLFEAVEYQFKNSTRQGAYRRYSNWYIKFVEKNFGKARGPLGYNLNLHEEDIILMTKICINNKEKLKLNTLFEEFEKRGIFFDRDSKLKIIELYEKLNLLEKKSDSGDAQYVKSIL